MDYGYGNTEVEAMDVDDEQQQQVEQDMGYEECAPQPRRLSGDEDEQVSQRRASIQSILKDPALSPVAKRRSIQHLMDGRRRSSLNSLTAAVSNTAVGDNNNNNDSDSSLATERQDGGVDAARRRSTPSQDDGGAAADMYGYGDAAPDSDDHYHPYHNNNSSSNEPQPPPQQHNNAVDNVDSATICNEFTRNAEAARPPCHHYDRRCTLIAPCCGAAFGCRICHDDCPTLPPKINNGGRRYHRSASLPSSFTHMAPQAHNHLPEDNHHTIDRFAVREIICRECFTRQSSKTNNCVNCGVRFGAYHCDICNLWMSDEESPYHCEHCGFCRVGGRANFQHCHQCGMCIDRGLYESHNCKAGKYRSNCPVCQEYLFSSRGASHEMPCGHAIHWDCFRQLAAHDSRCPVCKKTAETRERMLPTWDAMAGAVALQPVPAELARVVTVTCNDCERPEESRAWHFLGVQCSHCQSFNTVVDRIVLQGEEAHEFLEMNRRRAEILVEQQQAQQPQNGGDPHPSPSGGGRRRRFNRRRSAF